MSKSTIRVSLLEKLYNQTLWANKWEFIEAKLRVIVLTFLLTYCTET